MQLNPDRLAAHLQQTVANCYLLHGDEPLLLLEAADQIRAAALAAGCTERAVFAVEGRFSWREPMAMVESGSLFADRRLLELRLAQAKPTAEIAAGLARLLEADRRDVVLLVSAPKLDRTALSSAWAAALADEGVVLALPSVEREALPAWLAGRLRANGQSAGREVLQFLSDLVEGNLLAAAQEVAKLALLCPPGALALDTVRAAVANVSRFDTRALSECLLAGDLARYLAVLRALEAEGEAPTLALWVVAEDVQAVLAVQRAARDGGSTQALAREYRLWGERAGAVERAARRWPAKKVVAALAECALLDRMAKGVAPGNPWLAFRALGAGLLGA